jgi:hypothetical protein
MAEQKKNTITRAQALKMAIATLDVSEDYLQDEKDAACEVLERMLASITKPRKSATSKTRLLNEKLAKQVVEHFAAGECYSSADVAGFGIAEITSTPKATAVLAVAVSMGLVTAEKHGKRNAYKLAE